MSMIRGDVTWERRDRKSSLASTLLALHLSAPSNMSRSRRPVSRGHGYNEGITSIFVIAKV